MFKLAMIALLSVSRASMDAKLEAKIKTKIEKVNTQNTDLEKVKVDSDTESKLLATQYWSTKKSKTCQECLISNGEWSDNACHDGGKAADKKQTLKNLFDEAAICKNPTDFCTVSTFDVSKFTSNAKYGWSLGVDKTKGLKFEQWNSLCYYSFDLPETYVGGIGINALSM